MKHYTTLKTTVLASMVGFIMLTAGVGTVYAHVDVLPRVNEALRQAGIAVTPSNQLAWAECVVFGHINCTSFEKLVDSMKWHKAHFDIGERLDPLPDSSKFIRASVHVTKKVTSPIRKARATVVSYRAPDDCTVSTKSGLLTVVVAGNQYLRFRVPCNAPLDSHVQVGSTVDILYRGTGEIRNAVKLTRAFSTDKGIGESGDCPTCGSGSSSSGSSGY